MLLTSLIKAVYFSFSMFWEILWALVLGFMISAVIQTIVSKKQMAQLMPDSSARTLAVAAGLGAASSSCSYAAVAIARSIFRKGGDFAAAIVFEFASTNLVIELGIIMAILLGWQFTLAEFVGGPLMIIMLALMFRLFLKKKLIGEALEQSNKGIAGIMEGHAGMDMSLAEGSIWRKMTSRKGLTRISHFYFMDWTSVWKDIFLGLIIAGALAAWVPVSFWQSFFLAQSGFWAKIWGPVVGPFISIISFVCSIGNVPMAAVLWNGGISFGGVISFIFADLIILPILNIYRKYYGWKMSAFLFITSYVAMVVAGLTVEGIFGFLRLIPLKRHALAMTAGVAFNYTTILNLVFIVISLLLLVRFIKTGGVDMLRMMNRPPVETDADPAK